MKIFKTKEDGITLVALVVTVIILVILAAVSVSAITGKNGLFSQANNASQAYTAKSIQEDLETQILQAQFETPGGVNLQSISNLLNSSNKNYIIALDSDMQDIITPTDTIDNAEEIYVVYNNYQFKINNKLKISYITTIEIQESITQNYELIDEYTMPIMKSNTTTIEGDGTYYCTSSSSLTSGMTAYYAFNGTVSSTTNCWHSANGDGYGWLQVEFPYMVQITNFTLQNRVNSGNDSYNINTFKLQASNDGITWTDIESFTNPSNTSSNKTSFSVSYEYGNTAYRYYRFKSLSAYSTTSYVVIGDLTLSGKRYSKSNTFKILVDDISKSITYHDYYDLKKIHDYYDALTDEEKALVSNHYNLLCKYIGYSINNAIETWFNDITFENFMTVTELYNLCLNSNNMVKSNIKRYNEFITYFEQHYSPMVLNYNTKNDISLTISTSSNIDANRTGAKIFDNSLNSTTGCWHTSSGVKQWIELAFEKEIMVNKFTLTNRNSDSTPTIIKNFSIQASNDKSAWIVLNSFTNPNGSGVSTTYDLSTYPFEKGGFKYYRLVTTTSYGSYISIGEMSFDILVLK